MGTPLLLGTAETAAHLKSALASEEGEAVLAVSYWGDGAARELGLTESKAAIRIICDLWSGRCNPKEIKRLLTAGAIIKTLDRFHAKTYCFSKEAVIGSNNASANGLGFEGSEAKSNVELSAVIQDAAFVAAVRDWFEKQWDKAGPVDRQAADDARPFWEAAQRNRPTQTSNTLLTGLAHGNPRLRNAPIWIEAHIADEPDRSAKQAFAKHGRKNYTDLELEEAEENYYLFFQDVDGNWPAKPGQVILCFEFEGRSGLPKFQRMWRVRAKPFIPAPSRARPRSRIVLFELINDCYGIRLPQREAALMGKAISSHLNKHHQWQGDEQPSNYGFLLWTPLQRFWNEHKSLLA